MLRLFDEETGYFLLDEIVLSRPSFQRITEDAEITDEEVMAQAELVIALLKRVDAALEEKEKRLVADALAELAVLYQINARKGGKS